MSTKTKLPTLSQLAEQILSVQPMEEAVEAFNRMYDSSKSEEWLKENGYEPICESTKMMWVRKK